MLIDVKIDTSLWLVYIIFVMFREQSIMKFKIFTHTHKILLYNLGKNHSNIIPRCICHKIVNTFSTFLIKMLNL